MVPISKKVYTRTTNYITYIVLALVAFCFLVPVMTNYSHITTMPPLELDPGAKVVWVDEDTMMFQTTGGKNLTNCPVVWIERGLETKRGRVDVTIDLLSGPMKGIGPQTGRNVLKDVKIGRRPPVVGLLIRPKDVPKEDILAFFTNQIVPQDQACENGWWGTSKLMKITVSE